MVAYRDGCLTIMFHYFYLAAMFHHSKSSSAYVNTVAQHVWGPLVVLVNIVITSSVYNAKNNIKICN